MDVSTPPADDLPGTPEDLKAYAESLLRESLGSRAEFRDGQWEAIELLVERRERLLVVQRTGWGKSSVYFLTTRLLRERGAGPTILISPLLALMRDQVRAAERFGVRAATINSTNRDEWSEIAEQMTRDEIDILLVSPERLANKSFYTTVLQPILSSIGMLVVDEAHCISDWGHDFRPDYRRIRALLPQLGDDVAVLATTATANNAVVGDVVAQLGGSIRQMRGPLSRASLRLQAIHIPAESDRMAWLAVELPKIDGSGIVYVLTKAHANRLAGFLNSQGIDAASYTGGGAIGGTAEKAKLEIERRLLANEIKVVVATPALGMGFDKPDLAFVIHFQMPQSLIHYYQQVGRAGRAVDNALGVLLHGDGDKRITDYFIAQAFPGAAAYDSVLKAVDSSSEKLTTAEVAKKARIGKALTEKVLGQLSVEIPAPVSRSGTRWSSTGEPFTVDTEHIAMLEARRREEYACILRYAEGKRCYMAYVAAELDDPTAQDCGRCAVCVGRDLVARTVDPDIAERAADFRETAKKTRTRRARPKRPADTTKRVKRRRRRG
jgi:ATP-dependent DNA helicase RecQ